MRPLTHTTTIEIAGAEVEVEISFTCSPIIRATGPTYSSGGEPASGGEVEIVSAVLLIEGSGFGATAHRYDAPGWLIDILQEDEDVTDTLREVAQEQDDAAEYAAEMRAEMRREEQAA